MVERDTIRQALLDAIHWQESLADAFHKEAPERADALSQVKAYRTLLKRRYGSDKTPMEQRLEDAGMTYVTLSELRKRNEGGGSHG